MTGGDVIWHLWCNKYTCLLCLWLNRMRDLLPSTYIEYGSNEMPSPERAAKLVIYALKILSYRQGAKIENESRWYEYKWLIQCPFFCHMLTPNDPWAELFIWKPLSFSQSSSEPSSTSTERITLLFVTHDFLMSLSPTLAANALESNKDSDQCSGVCPRDSKNLWCRGNN